MIIKQIPTFADEYLRFWFHKLPSHAAFYYRLNWLSEAFKHFAGSLLVDFKPNNCTDQESLLVSMPIITCSGKRTGKVARGITVKASVPPNQCITMDLNFMLLHFNEIKVYHFQSIFLSLQLLKMI